MSPSVGLGPRDKDQLLRFGVIGGAVLAVVIYGYIQLRTPDAPPPPVAAPVVRTSSARVTTGSGTTTASATGAPVSPGPLTKAAAAEIAAGKVGTTAAQYDPTLKMQPMLVAESLVYSGSGRNIFSTTSAQPQIVIPKIVTPVRNTGVVLPVYQPPAGPPPPPPIDLKFFGTETLGDGTRQAFLLHGEDVFLAATGSIVQRRYKIGAVSASSVEVEDLTNNNKQSLQLQKN